MDGMLGTLCAGVFLLAVVTLVGHGIFVVLSFLFKTKEMTERPSPAGSDTYCPTCRSPLGADRRLCKACGWPLSSPAQAPRSVGLEAVQRELARLVRVNLLDAATSERLVEAVRLEQAKLGAASTAPRPDAPRERSPQPATAESAKTDEPEELVLKPARVFEPAAAAPLPPSMPAEVAAEVGYRVQAYAERRSAAEAESDEAGPPAAPARPWSQLLTHFMEEKNIRWGELVGGLLIVCCSIALVISFWSKIAERPFIKFFVFNGVTAGLFGVGF
jgi:hypothetical protein